MPTTPATNRSKKRNPKPSDDLDRILPNGAYQLPELWRAHRSYQGTDYYEPRFPCPAFLVIDVETTGTNHRTPYPGFKFPARPFAIGLGAYDPDKQTLTEHQFKCDSIDPHTREVKWSKAAIRTVQHLINKYRCITRSKVLHNAPFDIPMLDALGVTVDAREAEDTLAASHVLDSSEVHELKTLAVRYLDINDTDQSILRAQTIDAREVAKDNGYPVAPDVEADYWMVDMFLEGTDHLTRYLSGDLRRTALLWIMQRKLLAKFSLWPSYNREQRVMVDTIRMMTHPIHLLPSTEETYIGYDAHRADAEAGAVRMVEQIRPADDPQSLSESSGGGGGKRRSKKKPPGFNIRSYLQLTKFIYADQNDTLDPTKDSPFQLPVFRWTDGGNPATGYDALVELAAYCEMWLHKPRKCPAGQRLQEAHDFLECVIQFRQYQTACGYIESYLGQARDIDGELYLDPRLNPWGTVTTRFSASGFNSMNVSSDEDVPVKTCFGPPPGWLWYTKDFDQLELRLMAKASGDPTLNHILSHGGDQHQMATDRINELRHKLLGLPPLTRKYVKSVNFAWQYGAAIRKKNGQPGKLCHMTGLPPDVLESMYTGLFPGVVAFMDETCALVRSVGFVETLFGYRLYPREQVNPWTGDTERPEYVGTNYKIQGTAGDILKNTILAVNDYIDAFRLSSILHILMTVHDEIILESKGELPDRHLRNLHRIACSAGDPIDCPTPAKSYIITHDWHHPQRITL